MRPSRYGDRVPGVLPALVLEPGLLVAALVRDVTVVHQVGVVVDPGERRPGLALERANQAAVAGPALVLVEQHDVERRGVGGAVVRRVRSLLERGHLAVPHLVEDPAWILVAEVVDATSLPVPERLDGRRCELRREGQRLQAREDAVAAEHGHEPRQAGSRKAVPSRDRRREAQRGEVDEAASIGRLQRVRVGFEARSVCRASGRGCAPCSVEPSARLARTSAGCRFLRRPWQ